MEGNKRDFKRGVRVEEGRKKREEVSIKLRKEKKEEGIAKRRNFQSVEEFADPVQEAAVTAALPTDQSGMFALYQELIGADPVKQLAALKGFRRLLSKEKNPPVQECIDVGAIPIFVQCLQRYDSVELQFEAAWALTNIASTDRTRVVVDFNAIPHLIALLTSPNGDLREQCAWCLGNIAGDSAELRELILKQNALEPILLNIQQPATLSLFRNCTWTLSNFCRGKPQPSLSSIASALPTLAKILKERVDVDASVDATWALSYISDGDDRRIQAVVDLGILPSLVEMINSGNQAVIVPALRTIGNIVSGNDTHTQAVLEANALPGLTRLLTNAKKNIRKETCWVLSNIAAGTPVQLHALLAQPETVSLVLRQAGNGIEWDVRREAAWVISNIITSADSTYLIKLVELGVLRCLIDLLDVGEAKIILITLDALEMILRLNESYPQINLLTMMDEYGGVEMIEKLQEHQHQKVYERAVHMIEKYFGVEDEEDGENIAPSVQGNTFSFGIPTASNANGMGKVAASNGFNTKTVFDFTGAANTMTAPAVSMGFQF